jgi:hypothetical protein
MSLEPPPFASVPGQKPVMKPNAPGVKGITPRCEPSPLSGCAFCLLAGNSASPTPKSSTFRPSKPGALRMQTFSPKRNRSPVNKIMPICLTEHLRSLCSTIITRFLAPMGLSDFHPRPTRALAGRQLPRLWPAHGGGSPVLTREPLARMSTPLPRRLGPVRLLLTSGTNGGLRPFIAGSALTLAVSRPARRSLIFQPACSLTPFGAFYTRGFDPDRCQPEPLRLLPAGATVAGWATFLPLG